MGSAAGTLQDSTAALDRAKVYWEIRANVAPLKCDGGSVDDAGCAQRLQEGDAGPAALRDAAAPAPGDTAASIPESAQVSCTDVDGNAIAKMILDKCRRRTSEENLSPHLAVVQVGYDPASASYTKNQERNCGKIGATFTHVTLSADTDVDALIAKVHELNSDASISGIIVQLPLPKTIRRDQVFEAIAREKDVDCVNPVNVGLVAQANPQFLPATPFAVLHILTYHGIPTKGKHCVVVGKSDIVGKPIALLLANEFGLACTVSMVDKHTEDGLRKTLIASADILVVAAGVCHLIRDPSGLKKGCVVIDVGIHRVTIDGKGKLQGDVDTKAVREACSLITPVPGGVGPVTSAALMENLVHAALLQNTQQAQHENLRRKPAALQKRATVSDLLQGQTTLIGA